MNFNDFKISDSLQKAITQLGYTTPTEIQLAAIPAILTGKDLIDYGIEPNKTISIVAAMKSITDNLALKRFLMSAISTV